MNILSTDKMTGSKKLIIMALCIAIGIVLQIVESMLDIFAVPGGKIGLANIATLIDMFILGGANAAAVSILRSFLGCLLYGGVPAMPYSVSGAVLSALCMWLLKAALYPKMSTVGISVVGAFVHNAAQIAVAAVIFQNGYLFTYLPVLALVGIAGGLATGFGAKVFLNKVGIS